MELDACILLPTLGQCMSIIRGPYNIIPIHIYTKSNKPMANVPPIIHYVTLFTLYWLVYGTKTINLQLLLVESKHTHLHTWYRNKQRIFLCSTYSYIACNCSEEGYNEQHDDSQCTERVSVDRKKGWRLEQCSVSGCAAVKSEQSTSHASPLRSVHITLLLRGGHVLRRVRLLLSLHHFTIAWNIEKYLYIEFWLVDFHWCIKVTRIDKINYYSRRINNWGFGS